VPAVGAVLAGGLVTAFGAGIAALAVVFAAKADAVKQRWKTTMGQMGKDAQEIAKPFQGVLVRVADIAANTFARFRPMLAQSFAGMALPVQQFAADFGRALERLVPAIMPLTRAFSELLRVLGPAFILMLDEFSKGMVRLSQSVQRGPTAMAELVRGIGLLLHDLLSILAILNDADESFRELSGGVSLVRITIEILRFAVAALFTPFILLASYIEGVNKSLGFLKDKLVIFAPVLKLVGKGGKEVSDALNEVRKSVNETAPATNKLKEAQAKAAEKAMEATQAFNRQVDAIFRLQNANLNAASAQLDVAQATSRAAAAAKENGKATSLNTVAGQNNRSALLGLAQAANKQTETMIRNKAGSVAAAAAAEKSRQSFVKVAKQMGFSSKAANQMAKDLIAIPNVTRMAKLLANKQDLDRKLANARAQLNDKNLTRERRAQINANITKLQAALSRAQSQINNLKGKTVEIKYTMNGVNLTAPSSVGRRASGGPINGPGGDRADKAGLFALSNNEWVIQASSAKKYGAAAMASVNAGTAQIVPGMASGGPVVNIRSWGIFKSVAQGMKILGQMAGGPALNFARSQAGKPYVWGGVGPGGYDCSGFMSAITNVIQGRNPYQRRFATGSLPAGLFVRGPGRFEIGWFRGNPGHTAGTLNGVNVESRGGRGVVVGPGARGARDRLFTSGVYHLKGYAKGGKVKGDPPFDGFSEWLMNLKQYKNGTPYVPEDGFAYLHKGERVTPASQNRMTFEFRSDGSPYMEFLIREFRKYVRINGGDVQKVLGGASHA
jgi:cell wall-associated NlpC family hydrolase